MHMGGSSLEGSEPVSLRGLGRAGFRRSLKPMAEAGLGTGSGSPFSQAIAEVGDLELRRGMIWEAPSATGPHGTAQEGPLPRVGWVRVCEVSELAGIS